MRDLNNGPSGGGSHLGYSCHVRLSASLPEMGRRCRLPTKDWGWQPGSVSICAEPCCQPCPQEISAVNSSIPPPSIQPVSNADRVPGFVRQASTLSLHFSACLSLSVTFSLSLSPSLINSWTFFFPSKLKFNVFLGSGLSQRRRRWSRCRGRGASSFPILFSSD